jgi:hypothetical protein
MIRFGLRLALASGREAAVRLTIIAAAVALGAGLLLATLAGINAVNAQNARNAWLNTGVKSTTASAAAGTPAADPLWWLLRGDYFHGQTIGRVDVGATGPHAPVPPGIPRLPGPGEFYASPSLSALLRSTPAAELGDRFPGHEAGTIGPSALPAPNSLLIIIGHTPDELSHQPGATQVTSIMTTDPSRCDGCFVGRNAAGMDLILSVVAAGLLFPLLILIGTAARLAATRREQRFAAMRLVGATPRQISVISAVESTVAAVAGTAVGFGLFYLFRPAIAAIPFTGAPFFPSDLSLGVVGGLLIALGIPVGAMVAARLALRRVQISPLGVSRRVTPRAPRAWRLIPLAIGIGELTYFVDRRPDTTDGQIQAYLTGIFLIMGGLVIAGPWLTMQGSRMMARRASRPSTLIAARRLSDNPQAGFRAVSGLMLALFVTSTATGVITTIVANRGGPPIGSAGASTLSNIFWPEERAEGQRAPSADSIPAGLSSVPGVQRVTVIHVNPVARPDQVGKGMRDNSWWPGVISCTELARTPALGSCPAGAEVAAVDANPSDPHWLPANPMVWPAAAVAPETLRQLPVLSVLVGTDGSASAIERARTALESAFPQRRFPSTVREWEADFARNLVQWQQLANVVILASLPIAGCSLAVSVAGGLNDRKRPFSMLRLTGAQLGVLRRVVALESAVPLLVVAAVAIGTGFLAAHLFLRSQMDYSLRPPGIAYYLIVVAGLAASLGIIASTLPLLKRITGPETARNE